MNVSSCDYSLRDSRTKTPCQSRLFSHSVDFVLLARRHHQRLTQPSWSYPSLKQCREQKISTAKELQRCLTARQQRNSLLTSTVITCCWIDCLPSSLWSVSKAIDTMPWIIRWNGRRCWQRWVNWEEKFEKHSYKRDLFLRSRPFRKK